MSFQWWAEGGDLPLTPVPHIAMLIRTVLLTGAGLYNSSGTVLLWCTTGLLSDRMTHHHQNEMVPVIAFVLSSWSMGTNAIVTPIGLSIVTITYDDIDRFNDAQYKADIAKWWFVSFIKIGRVDRYTQTASTAWLPMACLKQVWQKVCDEDNTQQFAIWAMTLCRTWFHKFGDFDLTFCCATMTKPRQTVARWWFGTFPFPRFLPFTPMPVKTISNSIHMQLLQENVW